MVAILPMVTMLPMVTYQVGPSEWCTALPSDGATYICVVQTQEGTFRVSVPDKDIYKQRFLSLYRLDQHQLILLPLSLLTLLLCLLLRAFIMCMC